MDAVDRAILEHLKFDGRSSMQDLSELTGLSRSAVFTRVKRLEDQGVIEGYTVRLNRKKLGMEIRAYCNVSLKLHERELLEEFESEIGRHSGLIRESIAPCRPCDSTISAVTSSPSCSVSSANNLLSAA